MKYKKGFIWIEDNKDGLSQHFTTLNYFHDLLKNFLVSGNFSTFTWNIGFGMDMFGNLAYYILGDFLSYFCVFVPKNYLHIFYYALVILRLYLVGIAFLCFCRYKKVEKGNIIGALMYTFCSYAIFAGVRHPYFMNALIIFPLLMIGVEKIILENKKIFYTLMICITCIISFYFAYMMFIIIAIYGLILIFLNYRKDGIKKILKKLFTIFIYSVIGILMASIVLLPAAIAFLTSNRSGNLEILNYSINYYRSFASSLISYYGGNWSCLGVFPIVLIVLPLFIKNRKDDNKYPIFILLCVLLIPLLISKVGSIFAGFSYPNNRWTYVISFLLSYLTTLFLNETKGLDKKDINYIIVFNIIYFSLIYLARISISLIIQINIIIAAILFAIFANKEKLENIFKKINIYNILIYFVVVIGIIYFIYYFYDIEQRDYVSEFLNFGGHTKVFNTAGKQIPDYKEAINFIKDKDNSFYKIGKSTQDYENLGIIHDYNSISYFYSIVSGRYTALSTDLQNRQLGIATETREFDYRTKITTLLGLKYYVGVEKEPFGYKKLEDYSGKSNIYENEYYLPFGTLYTNYITENEYNNMSPLEKESSMLKSITIKNNDLKNINIEKNENVLKDIRNKSIKKINYKIEENDILKNEKDKNIIKIEKEKNNKIVLDIDSVKNSEIYIDINGIKYEPYSKKELIKLKNKNVKDRIKKSKTKNKYIWYEKNYSFSVTASIDDVKKSESVGNKGRTPYYFDNQEMLMNLGYFDEISGKLTLTFSNIGTYSFDSIDIYAVNFDDYKEDIEALRKSNFEVTSFKDNLLEGTANVESNGILQFQTLYSDGFTVYVDGKKAETLEVNNYFLGININKGKHTIKIEYETPYLKLGIIITIIATLIFMSTIIIDKRKSKNSIEHEKQ